MPEESEKRVRLVVNVPEEVRQALRLAAAETGGELDMGDLITEWVRREYREQLRRIRRGRRDSSSSSDPASEG